MVRAMWFHMDLKLLSICMLIMLPYSDGFFDGGGCCGCGCCCCKPSFPDPPPIILQPPAAPPRCCCCDQPLPDARPVGAPPPSRRRTMTMCQCQVTSKPCCGCCSPCCCSPCCCRPCCCCQPCCCQPCCCQPCCCQQCCCQPCCCQPCCCNQCCCCQPCCCQQCCCCEPCCCFMCCCDDSDDGFRLHRRKRSPTAFRAARHGRDYYVLPLVHPLDAARDHPHHHHKKGKKKDHHYFHHHHHHHYFHGFPEGHECKCACPENPSGGFGSQGQSATTNSNTAYASPNYGPNSPNLPFGTSEATGATNPNCGSCQNCNCGNGPSALNNPNCQFGSSSAQNGFNSGTSGTNGPCACDPTTFSSPQSPCQPCSCGQPSGFNPSSAGFGSQTGAFSTGTSYGANYVQDNQPCPLPDPIPCNCENLNMNNINGAANTAMNPSVSNTGGLNAFMNFNNLGGFGSSLGNQNPQTHSGPQAPAEGGDNEPSLEDCQYVENAMRWLNQQQQRETQPNPQSATGCNCGFNGYGSNYGQSQAFTGFNGNPQEFAGQGGYGANFNGFQPNPEAMYGGGYGQQQSAPYNIFQKFFNRKKRQNPTISDRIFDFFFPLQDDFDQYQREFQRINEERTERPRRCCDCCCYFCCNNKREANTRQKDENASNQNRPSPDNARPSRPIFETPHDNLYRPPHKILPEIEPISLNSPPEIVNPHLQPPPIHMNHLIPPHIEIPLAPPRILQPAVETPYPHQLRFNLKKRKR